VLYLVHYPLIIILCKLAMLLLPRTLVGAAVAYTMILILCLLAAVAVHLWIEKPLLHNLGKNRRAAVTAP
jgi:peptidoglycan/LPS O-acetylase OafA/YrhL